MDPYQVYNWAEMGSVDDEVRDRCIRDLQSMDWFDQPDGREEGVAIHARRGDVAAPTHRQYKLAGPGGVRDRQLYQDLVNRLREEHPGKPIRVFSEALRSEVNQLMAEYPASEGFAAFNPWSSADERSWQRRSFLGPRVDSAPIPGPSIPQTRAEGLRVTSPPRVGATNGLRREESKFARGRGRLHTVTSLANGRTLPGLPAAQENGDGDSRTCARGPWVHWWEGRRRCRGSDGLRVRVSLELGARGTRHRRRPTSSSNLRGGWTTSHYPASFQSYLLPKSAKSSSLCGL